MYARVIKFHCPCDSVPSGAYAWKKADKDYEDGNIIDKHWLVGLPDSKEVRKYKKDKIMPIFDLNYVEWFETDVIHKDNDNLKKLYEENLLFGNWKRMKTIVYTWNILDRIKE